MNISKQLSMLPTYEGLNGQSVIGQGLIVKFTMEANSNVFKNSLIFRDCSIAYFETALENNYVYQIISNEKFLIHF